MLDTLQATRDAAAAWGLDLLAALSRHDAIEAVPAIETAWPSIRTFVLLGSGRGLWPHVSASVDVGRVDPVDHHVDEALDALVAGPLAPLQGSILWSPTRGVVPVSALAERAGWGRASPLGLLLHPERGTWFALRGLLGLAVDLRPPPPVVHPHACFQCRDAPCVTLCPSGAVDLRDGLDVHRCFSTRSQPGPCLDGCASRRACPVGPEHRYAPAQERHHHHAGTEAWRRWSAESQPRPPEWKPHRGS